MKAPAALLLLLVAASGCSEPVDDAAWIAYQRFATSVHSGNMEDARGMLQHKVPPGWTPRIGGPPAPTKHFRFKSVEVDRKSLSIHGDTATVRAEVTVLYADKRGAPEVIFVGIFGGGEWFQPDEKLKYTHQATMTRVDGAWKVSDVQIFPKN